MKYYLLTTRSGRAMKGTNMRDTPVSSIVGEKITEVRVYKRIQKAFDWTGKLIRHIGFVE